MQNVSSVSLLTVSDVADYLRLVEVTQADEGTLTTLLNVAKSFVCQYTGRTPAEVDTFEDFVIVVLILVQDMWDNRTLYVDSGNLNKTVESILGLHSVNLLPEV